VSHTHIRRATTVILDPITKLLRTLLQNLFHQSRYRLFRNHATPSSLSTVPNASAASTVPLSAHCDSTSYTNTSSSPPHKTKPTHLETRGLPHWTPVLGSSTRTWDLNPKCHREQPLSPGSAVLSLPRRGLRMVQRRNMSWPRRFIPPADFRLRI